MGRLEMLVDSLNEKEQDNNTDDNAIVTNVFDKLFLLSIGDTYKVRLKEGIEEGLVIFKYKIKDIGCIGICVVLKDKHNIKYYKNPNINSEYNLEVRERSKLKKDMALEVYTRYIYKDNGRYEDSTLNITYDDLSDDEIGKKYSTTYYGDLKDIIIKEKVIAELKYRDRFGALVFYNEVKSFNDGNIGEKDFVEWVHF